DVRTRRHRGDRLGSGRTQLIATILDRAVEADDDDDPAFGLQVGEVALLMLEPALADDVELGVVTLGPLDESGHGGALEPGQVLTGEVGAEIRGGEARPPVDLLHEPPLPGRRDSLPVTRPPP